MPELLDSFRAYLSVQRDRAPGTVKRYAGCVEQFANFLRTARRTDNVALETVKKDELLDFLYARAGATEEPSSAVWNNTLSALRGFYTYLRSKELVRMDPTALVERHKVLGNTRTPLSLTEMIAMTDAAAKHSPEGYATRNVAILKVLFHCGLRLSEVASLDLARVDLENRWFSDVRVKGGAELTITFNDVVAEAVEQYAPERAQLLGGKDTPALFISLRRGRLCKRAIQNLVKHYAKLAGIKRNIFPHIIRHTSGTEYASIADMHVVKDLLGHKDVRTTQVYTHSALPARRAANVELGKRWKRQVARGRRAPIHEKGEQPTTA